MPLRLQSQSVPPEEEEEEDARFVVVTFYKFVSLEDPHAEVVRHLNFLQVLLPSCSPPSRTTVPLLLLHPIYHMLWPKFLLLFMYSILYIRDATYMVAFT